MATDEHLCPSLAKIYFLKDKDDSFGNPERTWKECCNFQKLWDVRWTKNMKLQESMAAYKKQKAINMVWLSNKLSGTLPEGISQMQTYHILVKLYYDQAGECGIDQADSSAAASAELPAQPNNDRDSEKNSKSQRQIKQHFQAFLDLDKASNSPLSEDLIKNTHKTLMNDLFLEDTNEPVQAGVYRTSPVHAGDHVFPSHKSVPVSMQRVVRDYNKKASDPKHDPFELASWLLFEVVTIHPFMDGNGRLCRLLWCFSLLRDGLPFPLTPSSGSRKAHDHYVHCIERDRSRRGLSDSLSGHLTTLTVVSVKKAWENFLGNIQYEDPEEYQSIVEQLRELN